VRLDASNELDTALSRAGMTCCLRGCPPQYEGGKRKYLLLETEDGPTVTKETDLVIFCPYYPEKLRTKESVLASGVAVAFGVKRMINRKAIAEAFEDGVILRRGMKIREGTLRHYLARQLRGLRCPQGVAGAQPRGHHGGSLHRRAVDDRTGPLRCGPEQGSAHHGCRPDCGSVR
jgi:hypothetical protein